MDPKPVQTSLAYFPHPPETADHIETYGAARTVEENRSSPDIRRNEPYPMQFNFEMTVEATVPKVI